MENGNNYSSTNAGKKNREESGSKDSPLANFLSRSKQTLGKFYDSNEQSFEVPEVINSEFGSNEKYEIGHFTLPLFLFGAIILFFGIFVFYYISGMDRSIPVSAGIVILVVAIIILVSATTFWKLRKARQRDLTMYTDKRENSSTIEKTTNHLKSGSDLSHYRR